jgi:hypothetical protein
MDYKNLAEVPSELAEFYFEEVVSELTGNTSTVFDIDPETGDEIQYQSPNRKDVIYLRRVSFGETKSLSDLERVIALGKTDRVAEKFSQMVANNHTQKFFEDYHEFLETHAAWVEHRDSFIPVENPDESLTTFDDAEPVAPNRYTPNAEAVLLPYLIAGFKGKRDKAMETVTVEVDGLVYNGDETSQNRMVRAIVVLTGSQKVPWTLADNTTVEVTQTQLKKALVKAGQIQAAMWVNPHRKTKDPK